MRICFILFSVSHPDSPPYPCGTFDRILLDAPCSALGQRPQFIVRVTLKELQCYPKLQRKLFTTVSGARQPAKNLFSSFTSKILILSNNIGFDRFM